MLQKTRGIVIHYIKYKESSIIVKIYTKELGLQTYIINSIRAAKSKGKIALFQPLTLLEMVVYYRKNQQRINRISEYKCYHPFKSIPFDYKKAGIALFIAEILHKSLKEESGNPELFDFLAESIRFFDLTESGFENFHLHFLLKLSRFLGFQPESAAEIFEQIQEHKKLLIHPDSQPNLEEKLNQLIDNNYDFPLAIEPSYRSELIDYLIEFYRLHIAGFDYIKSLAVLREMNQ